MSPPAAGGRPRLDVQTLPDDIGAVLDWFAPSRYATGDRMVSPDLEAAYRGTNYVVEMPGGARLSIRCGERSEDLDRLLDEAGVVEWAFVTACNPRSTLLDDAGNALRMARLDAWLRDRGLIAVAGSGEGDAGDWPAEPSRLVLGISEADAVALGRLFEQNAILAGARGHAARLVWIAW